MLPILAAVPACYALDFAGANNLWVVIPAGVVSVMGIIYVGCILMLEGPIATYKKHRSQRSKRGGS